MKELSIVAVWKLKKSEIFFFVGRIIKLWKAVRSTKNFMIGVKDTEKALQKR